jgi:hypothetical protein
MAEKAVGISCKILQKIHDDGVDFRDLLQAYRNTPLLGGIDASPAQILFSRRIRNDLPTARKALEPIIQANVYDALSIKQAEVKLNHDKTARRKETDFKKGGECSN